MFFHPGTKELSEILKHEKHRPRQFGPERPRELSSALVLPHQKRRETSPRRPESPRNAPDREPLALSLHRLNRQRFSRDPGRATPLTRQNPPSPQPLRTPPHRVGLHQLRPKNADTFGRLLALFAGPQRLHVPSRSAEVGTDGLLRSLRRWWKASSEGG